MTARRRQPGNPANRTNALTPYWHGGATGLAPGHHLYSAQADEARLRAEAFDYDHLEGSVFVTTDRELARAFAFRRGGSLYNVRPVGDLTEDPDYPSDPPVSFGCPSAIVVKVVERAIRMSEQQAVRANARYATWSDGSPMYDSEGFMTVGPDALPSVTPELLRSAGPWRDWSEVEAYLSEVLLHDRG